MSAWLQTTTTFTLASTAVVTASTVGFYVLEHCTSAECPFAKSESFSPVILQRFLSAQWTGNNGVYQCILQSEVASLCLILSTWAVSALFTLGILALLCASPRGDELAAFQQATAMILVQAGFMMSYVVALSQQGFADVTTILLAWAIKFVSRQLQTVLPLRSAAIKRAHSVSVGWLLALTTAYVVGALALGQVSIMMWRQAAGMSAIVFFEMWAAPLAAIKFALLAGLEALHVAEEMSMRAMVQGRQPYVTPDRRQELSDNLKLAHSVLQGTAVLCHRLGMLHHFGMHWRVGDVVLLFETRVSSQNVLKSIEHHLQNCLTHIQIDRHYPNATSEEVGDVQTCAICHAGLQHGCRRQLAVPKRLPCGHVFHLSCVQRWMLHSLGKEATCPMCRSHLPNALEADGANCWQAQAAGWIRWWLDWPFEYIVQALHRVIDFGGTIIQPPPNGEHVQGQQHGAPGTPRAGMQTRLRAVTMHGTDPTLATRMLEGYLTVRESLERREGMYTVIGHAEAADGAVAATPSYDNVRGSAAAAARPARQRGAQGGGAELRGSSALQTPQPASAPAETGVQRRSYRRRHLELEGVEVGEPSLGSEIAAIALTSPVWGLLTPRHHRHGDEDEDDGD